MKLAAPRAWERLVDRLLSGDRQGADDLAKSRDQHANSKASKEQKLTDTVYHYTSIARLPWIISEGVLRPGSTKSGDMPADFLWATVNPNGDRTAAVDQARWRNQKDILVRFSLPKEEFTPWKQLAATTQGWEKRHVDGLVEVARSWAQDESEWFARTGPLTNIYTVHTKVYGSSWQVLENNFKYGSNSKDQYYFELGRWEGSAKRVTLKDGRTAYNFGLRKKIG